MNGVESTACTGLRSDFESYALLANRYQVQERLVL